MKSSPRGKEPPREGVIREACILCLRFVALRFVVAAAAVVRAGGVQPITKAPESSWMPAEHKVCVFRLYGGSQYV